MKKSILFLLGLSFVLFSCSKNIPQPVIYSVTDVHGDTLHNVYIADTGNTTIPIMVKFLTGNIYDSVKIILSGLPARVTVVPDSFAAKPTYTANFLFTAQNAAIGTYPITITSSSPTNPKTSYKFNLVVVSSDCAALFNGTLNGSDACSATNYTFTSTCTGGSGTISINNFGGYGSNTNASVVLNCNNNTLTVPSQSIGNGVSVQGTGTFTGNSMVISYTATGIPSGGNDACTVTYIK